eukprot:TRINITY_DN67960_c7_g8_i1.p1 TRINITY_DN67960_c7_g8~~TRINITY_DN67960_c7_g8_i1.p1  ORF type:complete len:651 (+),score=60.84 TRINITY_DN67960_c7_g8_i1:110-2062(+)
MPAQVVVVGMGAGGLATVESLQPAIRTKLCDVTVIEPSQFVRLGLCNQAVLFHRYPVEQFNWNYSDLKLDCIFLADTVSTCDIQKRTVTLGSGRVIPYDFLVIAAGTVHHTKTWGTGVADNGFDMHSLDEMQEAMKKIDSQAGGNITLSILDQLYKCPPAPFEYLGNIDDYLKKQGKRDKWELAVTLPSMEPMPVAGPVGVGVREKLEARGVKFVKGKKVKSFAGKKLTVVDAEGDAAQEQVLPCDVWLKCAGVHGHPLIGNLTKHPLGLLPVDTATLESKDYKNVFAVGDIAFAPFTQECKAKGKPMPRAAELAFSQASAVGNIIANRIMGKEPTKTNPATMTCDIELEGGDSFTVSIQLLHEGGPKFTSTPPGPESGVARIKAYRERFFHASAKCQEFLRENNVPNIVEKMLHPIIVDRPSNVLDTMALQLQMQAQQADILLYRDKSGCPFTLGVELQLDSKRLKYRTEFIDPKADWYTSTINSEGTVPTLAYKGKIYTDSMEVINVIEKDFPKPDNRDGTEKPPSRVLPSFKEWFMNLMKYHKSGKAGPTKEALLSAVKAVAEKMPAPGQLFGGVRFSLTDMRSVGMCYRLVTAMQVVGATDDADLKNAMQPVVEYKNTFSVTAQWQLLGYDDEVLERQLKAKFGAN